MTTEIAMLEGKEDFTEEELSVFEQQYMSVMKNLSDMTKQKKKIEKQEKLIKANLGKVMDEYGIKSLDNQFLKIIRVAESKGKATVDLDKMQKEEPELFDELIKDYPKTAGAKKASIRFDVK
jgi:septal ring factor EnvC (AmiA/AmiB activator)